MYQIALTGLPDKQTKKGVGVGEEYQWEIVMVLKIIIQFEVRKHRKTNFFKNN